YKAAMSSSLALVLFPRTALVAPWRQRAAAGPCCVALALALFSVAGCSNGGSGGGANQTRPSEAARQTGTAGAMTTDEANRGGPLAAVGIGGVGSPAANEGGLSSATGLVGSGGGGGGGSGTGGVRVVENFNQSWKFRRADVTGAEAVEFNDSSWEDV